MPYHHLALATHDIAPMDRFYTQAMGFDLVKVEVAPTPTRGFAKHFFYDTGKGELMAFWELFDEQLPQDFPVGMSVGVGLPEWVNHLAFAAESAEDMERKKQRWLDCGYDVLEIDHHWCRSIYTNDPDGTMVEFCINTQEFTEEDRAFARKAVGEIDLEEAAKGQQPPKVEVFRTENEPVHLRTG